MEFSQASEEKLVPEFGKYAREPRPESVDWLRDLLDKRPNTACFWRPPHDFRVVIGDRSVRLHLNNIYTVSEADVLEIRAEMPDVDAIVTVNSYNSYSKDAKKAALEAGVGLFTAKELLGAINFTGDRFLHYISREEREREEKRRAEK